MTTTAVRFAVGEKVFFRHPEHSWIVGQVMQTQANPAYKPHMADMPQHARKKEHSAMWYHISAVDKLMPGAGSGETTPFVEDWRVDVYEESIETRPADDLLSLVHLHDAAILRTLAVRYYDDIIYTNIGVIVVAINPFNLHIPRYQDSKMASYLAERGQTISDKLLPHTWAQAHNTYHELVTTLSHQSILISGESGAGKTEAAKIVVKYLSHVSVANGSPEEQAKAQHIAKTITACSPILEAFGNAKTVRNDNSSRFGKLLNLKFDKVTHLFSGALAINYLLEKSRVMTCGKGERIYHSFYVAAAGKDAKSAYALTDALTSYRTLYSGGVLENGEFSTSKDYDDVCAAMENVSIKGPVMHSVWKITCGILKLGNVVFTSDGGEGSQVQPASQRYVDEAATLWGVSASALVTELTTTELTIMGNTTRKLLPVHKAVDARDALCKALYSGLFDWLVRQCNAACDVPEGAPPTVHIALLDIFGFESFDVNSFEQLCINYANETLQQHYNWFVFTKDMEVCRAEGIDTVNIQFPDLNPTLQMLQGMFSALDDQCALNGSEAVFVEELVKKYHNNPAAPNFVKDMTKRNTFGVAHFAGNVTYNVDGWIEKNRDTLKPVFRDSVFAEASSESNALSAVVLAPPPASDAPPSAAAAGPTSGGKKKTAAPTVANHFKQQMATLMECINATNPRWIRCVKPHTLKMPKMFSGSYTLRQLEFSGILGTVKIRKAGYPIRYPHKAFCIQFAAIAMLGSIATSTAEDIRRHCALLLKMTGLERAPEGGPAGLPAQLGKTLVFLKSDAFYELERQRKNALVSRAVLLQSCGRGLFRRQKVLQMKKTRVVQRVGRGYLSNLKLNNAYALKHAARILEARQRREELDKLRKEEERQRAVEAERQRNLELKRQEERLVQHQREWEEAMAEEECARLVLVEEAEHAKVTFLLPQLTIISDCRRKAMYLKFLKDTIAPLEAVYDAAHHKLLAEEHDTFELMLARERPVRKAMWLREQFARVRRDEMSERARLVGEWEDDLEYLTRFSLAAWEKEAYRQRKTKRMEAAALQTRQIVEDEASARCERNDSEALCTAAPPLRNVVSVRLHDVVRVRGSGMRGVVSQVLPRPHQPAHRTAVCVSLVTSAVVPFLATVAERRGKHPVMSHADPANKSQLVWCEAEDLDVLPPDCPEFHHVLDLLQRPQSSPRQQTRSSHEDIRVVGSRVSATSAPSKPAFDAWKNELIKDQHVQAKNERRETHTAFPSWQQRMALLEEEEALW